MTLGTRLLLVGLAALRAVAPSCAELRVGPIEAPSEPLQRQDTGRLVVPFEVDCADLPPAALFPTVVVTSEVEVVSGVTVTGQLERVIPTDRCIAAPTGAVGDHLVFSAHLVQEAPGLVPLPIHFALEIKGGGALGDQNLHANATTHVTAALWGGVKALVPSAVERLQPGAPATQFVEVTSLGNAPLVVAVAPAASDPAWGVEAPATLLLPWPPQAPVLLPVTLVAPARPGAAEVTLTLTPSAAADPSVSYPAITVTLRVESKGAVAPSPIPGILVVTLLACALLAARARRA